MGREPLRACKVSEAGKLRTLKNRFLKKKNNDTKEKKISTMTIDYQRQWKTHSTLLSQLANLVLS